MTKIEVYREEVGSRAKQEFDALIEEMKGEKNPMVSAKIELKLRALSSPH